VSISVQFCPSGSTGPRATDGDHAAARQARLAAARLASFHLCPFRPDPCFSGYALQACSTVSAALGGPQSAHQEQLGVMPRESGYAAMSPFRGFRAHLRRL
jgi:hypothetical protein